MRSDPSSSRLDRQAGRGLTLGSVTGLGLDMAVGMAVFAFLGYWVDYKRDTGPFWTLWGVFLGLAYCAYEVWKVVRLIDTEPARKDPDTEPPV